MYFARRFCRTPERKKQYLLFPFFFKLSSKRAPKFAVYGFTCMKGAVNSESYSKNFSSRDAALSLNN